jgi:hypothetical protein
VYCATGRGSAPSVGDGPEALDGGRQRAHLLIARALERRREHVCDVRTSPSPRCFPAGDTSCGRTEGVRPAFQAAVEHAEGGAVHRSGMIAAAGSSASL